ncbi:PPM-type phosphatase-like domain [Dillenia turbinata]|uniref:PPM-type phosphatase-like domain n=1 Tax=Dillenia turbinata TaxID=194707 RepID=A0AAN8W720_9MAGN
MAAEAEVVCRKSVRVGIPLLDVQYRCNLQEINEIVATPSPSSSSRRRRSSDLAAAAPPEPNPSPSILVVDGHGGPEAAAYIRKNAMRIFFEDVNFPNSSQVDNVFLKEVEDSLRKAFLLADVALDEDASVSSSSGTTARTALVFGRILMVANAGDCCAVLYQKGEAVDMSQDHRPVYPSERRRVEQLSEPEFQQVVLTKNDEFLIIGYDRIWDVMSIQHAVNIVRHGLQRHDNPEQSAGDLVMEALRLNTSDKLTMIIVCFTSFDNQEVPPS